MSGLDKRGATVLGFLGGLVVGLVVWTGQQRQSRHSLFAKHPLRRLAALGYLRGRPSVENARLLREYVSWERHPALRKRGQALLRIMETYLD